MRKKPPCFPDCPDRTITCHQFCRRYKDWKAEDQRQKEIRDREKEREWITYSERVKRNELKMIKEGRK